MVPDEDQGRFPDLLAALAWWLLPSQRGAVMAEMELLTNTFLPPGKTCADCVHCRRCCALFGQTPTGTSCDFWPSRFRESTIPPEERGDG